MNLPKKIVTRIIPVGLLAFSLVATIAYHRGVYDFTFIDRPESTHESSGESLPDSTDNGDSDSSSPNESTDSATSGSESESTIVGGDEVKTDAITDFLNTLKSTEELLTRNYSVTDEVFTHEMRLSLLELEESPDKTLSHRNKDITVYERIPHEIYSTYTTEARTESVPRLKVEVYMDYLLVDNGRNVTVFDKYGKALYHSLNIDKYVPAFTRDKNDNPLFRTVYQIAEDGAEQEVYCYIDSAGNMVDSEYVDATDNRGLYFNYPSYFGKSDNGFVVSTRYDKFGYAYEGGGNVFTPRYEGAFNFSEDVGIVITHEWMYPDKPILGFLNKYFYNQFTLREYYFNYTDRRVKTLYIPPDTRGIESLGYFYYENGLTRVRRRDLDYYKTYLKSEDYMVVSDDEIVIDKKGVEFPMPSGYTVKAYSNGVFMMEQDGRYGFYDHTERWIAQPIYDYAEPFNEGLAVVGKSGKYGMIDTKGRFVIPMIFDSLQSCSGGLIAAWDEANGWHIFNKLK